MFPRNRSPLKLMALGRLKLPLMGQSVHAGFPSPADDFVETTVDLNDVIITNPTATFLWRVVGDCLIDGKVFHDDVIVVDRSETPKHRSIVLAVINGEPTLKRLHRKGGRLLLQHDNKTLPPFVVDEGSDVSIWGVVTWTLRSLAK